LGLPKLTTNDNLNLIRKKAAVMWYLVTSSVATCYYHSYHMLTVELFLPTPQHCDALSEFHSAYTYLLGPFCRLVGAFLQAGWGLSAGYQPRPQVVDRGTTARYGGQLRYI